VQSNRVVRRTALWLLAGIFLAGCGSTSSSIGALSAAMPSPSPAPQTPRQADTPRPTSTTAPTETPLPAAIELTILHTNDNWGATEPCG
jgi:2',3'-cyclic-nucleotide 2'-phosphodiesterase (5'-nucleotidase family)